MPGLDGIVGTLAAAVEFGGSLLAAIACLRGLAILAAGRLGAAALLRARLSVADGLVSALGYKTAATLLKTIELRRWDAIGLFAAVLALRTLIKRVLVWDEARLRAEISVSAPPATGGTGPNRPVRPGT